MSYGPCPNANEFCKLYSLEPVVPGETNGCRSNEHHIYRMAEAKKLGKKAVEFASLPCHRVQLCEVQHQDIEAEYGWPMYPSLQDMLDKIEKEKDGSI